MDLTLLDDGVNVAMSLLFEYKSIFLALEMARVKFIHSFAPPLVLVGSPPS